MSVNTMVQRQWVGYSATHQNRANLAVHVIAVPLFMVGTLAALYGLVMLSPLALIVAMLGFLVSLVLQRLGHTRESIPPEPFTNAWDFRSRIIAEQWITFPRFVVTGGWLNNMSQSSREKGEIFDKPPRQSHSTSPHEGACAMAVTLINVFSVPKGKEDEFVNWWQDVKANITKQPGFMNGKFHRSIKPDGKFNFINVAIWDSEDVYWKAYEKSVTPMKAKLEQLGVEMVPALYNVVFEY